MMRTWCLCAATGILVAASFAAGQKDESWLLQTNLLEKAAAPARVAKLPKVLILGDSISLGYTPIVKKRLAGVAEVSRPSCNCGPSEFYLKSMKDWVGTNRWDVIHVNFGIWDNHYLKGPSDGMGLYWGREITNALPPIAKGVAIRDLGFRIRTPIKDYERNLRTILTFLKTRADRVVFGLTTPLKLWQDDDRCGRIRVYNELAVEVCRELGVGITDLYAVAERNLDKQTDGCHFNGAGYSALADEVIRSLKAEGPLSERCESAPAGSVARQTPEWFARGVIYQLQPRAFTAEGTLKAATARIPWLRDLGVTVIYLNPVFVMDDDMDRSKWSGRQKASGFDSPCNLYRIKDYDHVDPEFGTDADLREFVEVAHRNGLKVLLDLVYLHCGPGARLVKEHPEFFKRHPDGTIAPSQWHFPLFDFTNPATRRHLIASGLGWVTGYGVDGFRCDVADETPADFWTEFRAAADKVKPDLVMIAEGVRPSNTIYSFDCNYHWPLCRSVLTSALAGKEIAKGAVWERCGTDFGDAKGALCLRRVFEQYAAKCPAGALTMNFTDNQDIANDAFLNRAEKSGDDNQMLGLALAYCLPGVPCLYNGQEIRDASRHSIFGHRGCHIDWSRQDAADAVRRTERLRELARLRRTNPGFATRNVRWLEVEDPVSVLAFERTDAVGKGFRFVGNFSSRQVTALGETLPPWGYVLKIIR